MGAVAPRSPSSLALLEAEVVTCRACPRLVAHRERVAAEKRAAYLEETYWGRPVPSFGDSQARVIIVGLAPAAHGANRTGRMFTGDRSGDFLYAALHETGFASQPSSRARDDGLRVTDLWVTATVRCAPPDNTPTPVERDTCAGFLSRELDLLAQARVLVALGGFAFDQILRTLASRGARPRPKPRFGHGVEVDMGERWLIGSFHPSQQNTFTGRLTMPMLVAIFARARELADRY